MVCRKMANTPIWYIRKELAFVIQGSERLSVETGQPSLFGGSRMI